MPEQAAECARRRRRATPLVGAALWLLSLALLPASTPADAGVASVTAADLSVLSHALVFREPPSPDGVLAIAYTAGDSDSKQDALAIAAEVGAGLVTRRGVLRPLVVDTDSLAEHRFAVVIQAAGAAGPALAHAWRTQHALCVTTDFVTVRKGECIIGIRTKPRVQIVLNEQAARAADVHFATAFLMMINEL